VLQERRVLVIGGAGYIGSALVRELLAHGYPVRVFDSLMYGEASLASLEGRPGFELIRGDTRNVEEISTALKGMSAVVHLGEIVGDPACQLNPDFTIDVNYLATRRIAEACRHMKIARFIFISSCSVYGAGDGLLDERSPLAPVSLYAKCKIEAERALLSMVGDGFHPTIFRLATVFGLSYRPRFDLVVNLLAARAVARGAIKIIGGTQWRPFVHVRDVGDVILQALGTPVDTVGGQIFNVGDDALNFQIRDLADFIRRAVPDVAIETEYGSNDARDYRVSFAKLRGALGSRRWRTIDEGIAEIKAAIEGGQVADYAERQYSNYLNFVGPE
jgi:nucleoside-diphosphate-sugar epimerase